MYGIIILLWSLNEALMDFPKKFYFSKTKDGVDYGTMPSGSLSVPRLMKGLPYWTRPSAPRHEEKKHLIISEPALASMSHEIQAKVAIYIIQLLEAGFSISLTTSDGLQALESTNLYTLLDTFTTYSLKKCILSI